MKLPISIVIPTYNEEKYLPKLLASIKKQTIAPSEIIVADNNSKDKTRSIAKKYGCKIVQGGMPGVGRNNGAKVAKEELLLFLDADVVLTPNFLEKTFKEVNERKLGIATCYIKPLSTSSMDNIIYHTTNTYLFLSKDLLSQLNGFCIFITKKLFLRVNGFDEKVTLAEDFDLLRRAKKYGKFDFLKSAKIPVSFRRLEEEGYLLVGLKYFLLQFYLIFNSGVRSDLFKYKFGRHK